jgi:hypothetical protein
MPWDRRDDDKRSQDGESAVGIRVSGGLEGRRERPAPGHGQPRPPQSRNRSLIT